MYPVLIQYKGFVLPAWHLFFVLGVTLGYVTLVHLWRLTMPAVDRHDLDVLFLLCYISGYFGARAFSIVTEGNEGWSGLWHLGAMAFYGAPLGALPCALAWIWYRRLPWRGILDLALPALMIALSVGRIGCLLNGCDYGLPVKILPDAAPPWWALTDPVLEDELARYPVTILESILALALAGSGFFALKRPGRRTPGRVGLGLAAGYAMARFLLEYLRGDDRGWIIPDHLSPSQGISLLILTTIAVLLIRGAPMRPHHPSVVGDLS